MGFDWDGMVHILYSLFSVPVGLYSMDQRLLSFVRYIPSEGLPLVTDILVDALLVWRAIRAVLQAGHQVHVEVFYPSAGSQLHARGQGISGRTPKTWPSGI